MEEMPKTYDTAAVEQRMLDKWLEGDYYRRSAGVGDCTVTIPPPNVTGELHMGHAMDDTIQDTFVRFNRMRGLSTRWILGTDHAGIATQTKVDKKLAGEGISRREIGREKFIEACWDWTQRIRRVHRRAGQAHGLLRRLLRPALHHGCRLRQGRAQGVLRLVSR